MDQDQAQPEKELLDRSSRVHFVGIGGIGMSALAAVLLARGKRVTGSDVKESSVVQRLMAAGVRVNLGHRAEAVEGAELVVATAAARDDNPELQEARRRGIPVVKRAELLGWLMSDSYGMAVAGTHGKTTTTGMLAFVLRRAGLDPTMLVGGEMLDFESHGFQGKGLLLVAEADEFDRSFLRLWPKLAIITSVEMDHPDCYADLEDLVAAFAQFAERVPAEGLLITCSDDPVLRGMKPRVPRSSYGFAEDAAWRLLQYTPLSPYGTSFDFSNPGGDLYTCTLQLSGRHYALNALAAIAAAAHVGVDPSQSAATLAGFKGTRRRYELVGQVEGVTVIDDYAHHPTAVAETLRAARERHEGQIWCVFQPHTVNRTERLLREFATAFGPADHVLMLPIYQPTGREEASTVTSRDLAATMKHPDVRCPEELTGAAVLLEAEVRPGDLVITMGAGDINRVGDELLERLMARDLH